jgi:uncharacterized protein YuzE
MRTDPDAPYVPIRAGLVARRLVRDEIVADYDANGKLLGVLLLTPNGQRILDSLADEQPICAWRERCERFWRA